MTDEPNTAPTAPTAAQPAGEPPTVASRVDAVVGDLAELDALPVSEHVKRYTDVHTQLQDILNSTGSPVPPVDAGR